MESVKGFLTKKGGGFLSGGTWESCNAMLDRCATTIYTAYASKNLNKNGLQLQSALLDMSVQFYATHGTGRIVDMIHPALAQWASLSSKCKACEANGPTSKSKDSALESSCACTLMCLHVGVFTYVLIDSFALLRLCITIEQHHEDHVCGYHGR